MTYKLPDIPEPVTLKIRDIEKLKVVELKDALKLRGCSAKGNNPALTARPLALRLSVFSISRIFKVTGSGISGSL